VTFETNVFINCPFDPPYLPLLRPLLFCVLDLSFEPRIALERIDSGEPRIEKIIELIRASKYAIHDLSRLRAEAVGEVFRMNMPFELGLDVGCRRFKGGRWKTKRCLILEAQRYAYQAAISDLSNSDIAVHNNEPIKVVVQVRNWLANQVDAVLPGPERIWGRFTDFMAANYDDLKARGFSDEDIEDLPIDELIRGMKRWLQRQ
jgi:hypothetical protein